MDPSVGLIASLNRAVCSVLPKGIGRADAAVFSAVFLPTVVYALVSPLDDGFAHGGWYYAQGWPVVYLERSVDPADKGMWRLWLGIVELRMFALALNLGVAGGVALVCTFLWRLHTACRRWWRFSLGEILLLAVIGAAGAWYGTLPVRQFQQEKVLVAHLEEAGWIAMRWEPVGPNWIMRPLVDIGPLDEVMFYRIREIGWKGRAEYNGYEDDPLAQGTRNALDKHAIQVAGNTLPRLQWCDAIHICRAPLTHEVINTLCNYWRECRRADFSYSAAFDDQSLSRIVQAWPKLEELALSGTSVSDQGLLALVGLPYLRALTIVNCENISVAGVARFIKICSSLRYVEVSGAWDHEDGFDELEELAERRGVDILLIVE